MIYFETNDLKIINDDFLKTNLIEENSVDLIITSPPYNVCVAYDSCRDDLPYEKYLEFSEQWLAKAYNLSKPDGRLCLNIPIETKDLRRGDFNPVYADIINVAREVGWKYRYTIIWDKGIIRSKTLIRGTGDARSPFIIMPVEVIVIFYKKLWRKIRPGISDITKEEFKKYTAETWKIHAEQGEVSKLHPAPFPLEIPVRCIKLFSFINDLVLDPFLGTGTTLVACALLKRRGIGVEISQSYCKIAKERILKEGNIGQKVLSLEWE